MTDTATTDTTTTDDTTDDTTSTTGTDTDTGNDAAATARAEAEKWKALARKHEKDAKDRARELERARQSAMTDAERAVADARTEGRAEALRTIGGKLARAEIRAAAGGRVDDDTLDGILEHLDLSAFVDDDGEVDTTAVSKFVDRIAPKQEDGQTTTRRTRDLGQGARGTSLPLNGDPLERSLKDKLGIR